MQRIAPLRPHYGRKYDTAPSKLLNVATRHYKSPPPLHRPENVAPLFEILWLGVSLLCGAPVRWNMLNMPKSVSD